MALYGLIDAQYILVRNRNMLAGYKKGEKKVVSSSELLEVTLQSIMKMKREYGFMYPILLWDSSPYHKSSVLSHYKKDRKRASEEEIKSLEEQADAANELAVKLKLQADVRDMKVDLKNDQTQKEVKACIKSEDWIDCGFHSVYRDGYEADDLAYMLGVQISHLNNHDKGYSAVLISADKDWINFQLPGVSFISCYNGSSYPEVTEKFYKELIKINDHSQKNYGIDTKLTQYQWGILKELTGTTHNNAAVWKHKELKWPEAMSRLLNGDHTLPEAELLFSCTKAMNMNGGSANGVNYIQDLKDELIKWLDFNNFVYVPQHFQTMNGKYNIRLSMSSYFDFLSNFKIKEAK